MAMKQEEDKKALNNAGGNSENKKLKSSATTREPATKATESREKLKANQDSIYTVNELTDAYTAFSTTREVVQVALKLAGIQTATLEEAKAIVQAFKEKEVR